MEIHLSFYVHPLRPELTGNPQLVVGIDDHGANRGAPALFGEGHAVLETRQAG